MLLFFNGLMFVVWEKMLLKIETGVTIYRLAEATWPAGDSSLQRSQRGDGGTEGRVWRGAEEIQGKEIMPLVCCLA